MNRDAEARSEYANFFLLLLFFAALMGGAAVIRPWILGSRPAPSPTATAVFASLGLQVELPSPTVVPTLEAVSTPTPLPTPAATPTPAQVERTEASPTYVVRPGDNLFQIGRRTGLTVDELVTANGIVDRNRIFVGQVLVIPDRPLVFASPVPERRSYTIRWGDTLWGIARAYGVDMEALAAANGISDPHWIQAGQTLTIPAGQ